jgi:hypothetical protein
MVFETSRRVRASDFREDWFKSICEEIGADPERLHRKTWEHVAVCRVFRDLSLSAFNAIGFGCGNEPVPEFLHNISPASRVVATDAPVDQSVREHWAETGQHLLKVIPGLPDVVGLSYRECDMRAIPYYFLTGDYDFTWSCGSFEHIGGIAAGLDFFCNQMKCLRPGGIAAHVTEFNVTSNSGTLESPNLSIFRKRDFEYLGKILAEQGDRLFPLDFEGGDEEADCYVDRQPYFSKPYHLVLELGGYTFTSFLLIAQRGGAK